MVPESMMWVSSCGPVPTADAVVSSRVGDAAVSELTMRVVPSFGPMGVVPSKLIGLFVLPMFTSAGDAEAPPLVVCVLSVCTDRCIGPGFGCMVAVVSSKMGDAAVLELAAWVSSFGPVGMTPSMLVGLFVSSIVMSAGRAETLPPVSTSCSMEAMKAAWRAACAGPRDVRRRFFGDGCALSVCTDRFVGPGLGSMAMVAAVSSKVGNAAALESTTWVSSLGPVGMMLFTPIGLFVSPMVLSV